MPGSGWLPGTWRAQAGLNPCCLSFRLSRPLARCAPRAFLEQVRLDTDESHESERCLYVTMHVYRQTPTCSHLDLSVGINKS